MGADYNNTSSNSNSQQDSQKMFALRSFQGKDQKWFTLQVHARQGVEPCHFLKSSALRPIYAQNRTIPRNVPMLWRIKQSIAWPLQQLCKRLTRVSSIGMMRAPRPRMLSMVLVYGHRKQLAELASRTCPRSFLRAQECAQRAPTFIHFLMQLH